MLERGIGRYGGAAGKSRLRLGNIETMQPFTGDLGV